MLYGSNFLNLVGCWKALISAVRITERYFITAGIAGLVRLRDFFTEIPHALLLKITSSSLVF